MKPKRTELDVDFIGGERLLTKEDEKVISDFLKQNKLTSKKSSLSRKPKTVKKLKAKV